MGRSAARVPRGGGGGAVGIPTYTPHNDPHDPLIMLNIHKWGKNLFKTISSGSHPPRSSQEVGCFSAAFEFSTKILSILSIDT